VTTTTIPMITFPNATITFQAGSVSIVLPDTVASALSSLDSKVDSLVSQGSLIVANQTHNIGVIMAGFDDLEQKMSALEDKESVLEATFDAVHQELVDMLTAGVTPIRVQALADRMDQLKVKMLDAAARDAAPASATPTPPDQPPVDQPPPEQPAADHTAPSATEH
jgi:hypothetical protein